jgi:hypothetical protein
MRRQLAPEDAERRPRALQSLDGPLFLAAEIEERSLVDAGLSVHDLKPTLFIHEIIEIEKLLRENRHRCDGWVSFCALTLRVEAGPNRSMAPMRGLGYLAAGNIASR